LSAGPLSYRQELSSIKDSELTIQYYSCLSKALKESDHQRILGYYNIREENMLSNIEQIVKENQGKIIVIIAGDDHYISLKDRFNHNSCLKKFKEFTHLSSLLNLPFS